METILLSLTSRRKREDEQRLPAKLQGDRSTVGDNNGKGRKLSKNEEKALMAQERQEIEREQRKEAPPVPFEPRCHVCRSPYRNFVDAMLIRGASFQSIADKVPGEDGKKLDRRSISRHNQFHLGYQEDALRKVLEEEAAFANQNYEEGVKGAFTHRGLLEHALRRFHEDLLSGQITVEARDALAVIQVLDKLNSENENVVVDELQKQVDCLIQAIREETGEDIWRRIAVRADDLYRGKKKQIPVTVDSEVTE